MMGRALLIIGALATLGFLASGVLGYLLDGPADAAMPRHVLVALAACLAQLFSHCWILIYLFITGWAIRETVQEGGLEARYVEEASRFKTSVTPWIVAAVVLGVATFLLGGATARGAVKAWIHHVLFFFTLAVQGWALWRELLVLRANQTLIHEVDLHAAAVLPGPEVAG
ncbi:MAG TPA: hypothetical protein VKM72_18215 [Thermoanaerobaculia bacterium]|nr:hypothetical protein [Thermoanaerobaculia bacterium]